MSDSNCHCGKWDRPDVTDKGKSYPYRTKISCEAPEIPVPECDEEEPTPVFDPETEEFSYVVTMYTPQCEPWQDSDGDNWKIKIA